MTLGCQNRKKVKAEKAQEQHEPIFSKTTGRNQPGKQVTTPKKQVQVGYRRCNSNTSRHNISREVYF